jgi:hypothetical protein
MVVLELWFWTQDLLSLIFSGRQLNVVLLRLFADSCSIKEKGQLDSEQIVYEREESTYYEWLKFSFMLVIFY